MARNKNDVIAYLAEKHPHLTKKDITNLIGDEHEYYVDCLANGIPVKLHGFINLDISKVAKRDGTHPQTGVPISIEAYKMLRAKPTEELKRRLNPNNPKYAK